MSKKITVHIECGLDELAAISINIAQDYHIIARAGLLVIGIDIERREDGTTWLMCNEEIREIDSSQMQGKLLTALNCIT